MGRKESNQIKQTNSSHVKGNGANNFKHVGGIDTTTPQGVMNISQFFTHQKVSTYSSRVQGIGTHFFTSRKNSHQFFTRVTYTYQHVGIY